MENLNLGVAKAIVANKITKEFISESVVEKNHGLMYNLIDTIKNSPILVKEYSVFDNIENKYTSNYIIASKFIDNNLAKFSNHSVDEINEAHKLLEVFVDETVEEISESKVSLYNAIGTLILESNNIDGDVNKMHQAYETVLNYIKENKNKKKSESSLELNEDVDVDTVLEMASNIYNEEFSTLTESEIELVKKIAHSTSEEKKELFESLKSQNIESLEAIESNGVADKINEAIDKLNKMVYSDETIAKDIVELTGLKESLN